MSPGDLFRGVAIGLAIAAPVGPIGLLCISRTLHRGCSAGLATGLGAATADGLYAAVAALGLTALSGPLVAWAAPVRLVGGALLVYLGLRTALCRPTGPAPAADLKSLGADYASALGLTLANPLTVLSFGAVFANLGAFGGDAAPGGNLWLVAGVFLGSAVWWVFLTTITARLARAQQAEFWRSVSRVVGLGIAAFGTAVWVAWLAGR